MNEAIEGGKINSGVDGNYLTVTDSVAAGSVVWASPPSSPMLMTWKGPSSDVELTVTQELMFRAKIEELGMKLTKAKEKLKKLKNELRDREVVMAHLWERINGLGETNVEEEVA